MRKWQKLQLSRALRQLSAVVHWQRMQGRALHRLDRASVGVGACLVSCVKAPARFRTVCCRGSAAAVLPSQPPPPRQSDPVFNPST